MTSTASANPWLEPDGKIDGLNSVGSGLVVVAHPDDETLWAGGLLMLRDDWDWTVIALCRGSDRDRRPRFFRALEELGAQGRIADLDDDAEQRPLSDTHVRAVIAYELDESCYDLVLTHAPNGEYTRHRRHEEVSRAVLGLWAEGRITASAAWLFAYQDDGGASLPSAISEAHLRFALPRRIWRRKLEIIEEVYGFGKGSWEHDTTPREEAFWRLDSPVDVERWLLRAGRVR